MEEKVTVTMSQDEQIRFEAFKAQEERARKQAEKEANMLAYRELVNETIDGVIKSFNRISEQLRDTKSVAIRSMMELVRMKRETLGLKRDGQWSYTFTDPDSGRRITVGCRTLDGWRDTVEEGIEMVMRYIESLAGDDNSKALVSMVLRLLSRDVTGRLKADKVLELRRIAEDSKAEAFIDGVKLIEESHYRTVSRIYLTAEVRDSLGAWCKIPLSITESGADMEVEQMVLKAVNREEVSNGNSNRL